MGVRNDTNPPALRIEDLLDGTSTGGIVVKDQNADLPDGQCRTSTHNTDYSTRCAVTGVKSSVCDVSGKGGPTR